MPVVGVDGDRRTRARGGADRRGSLWAIGNVPVPAGAGRSRDAVVDVDARRRAFIFPRRHSASSWAISASRSVHRLAEHLRLVAARWQGIDRRGLERRHRQDRRPCRAAAERMAVGAEEGSNAAQTLSQRQRPPTTSPGSRNGCSAVSGRHRGWRHANGVEVQHLIGELSSLTG